MISSFLNVQTFVKVLDFAEPSHNVSKIGKGAFSNIVLLALLLIWC